MGGRDSFAGIFLIGQDKDGPDEVYIGGRALVLLAFVAYGIYIIAHSHARSRGMLPEISGTFMHTVNLVFHEAGHIIFMPFGRFMTVLGGSLMQLIVPATIMGTFLWQRNPFGAVIGLWWLGGSMMDLAPYISDASAMKIMLLGGFFGGETGAHDWNNLLGPRGLLRYDHALGMFCYVSGVALMVCSFLWGGACVVAQALALRAEG
jgi:hypothetical protein